MQTFNLGKLVGSTNFTEVPTGPQVVKCEAAEAVTSSTGKPMVKISLRIQGGVFAGRSVKDQLTLTVDNPDALGFFVGKLAAFGCDDQAIMDQCENTLDPIAKALVGQCANVTLFSDTYNGIARPKVKSYDSRAFVDDAAIIDLGDDDPGF